ncbi:MAG: DUF3108 domain-containing protein [Pyrinomonadaceae bacterium]|nr:DUF3108 domain-containing protein [Pyrinomonadaceae bacterium]
MHRRRHARQALILLILALSLCCHVLAQTRNASTVAATAGFSSAPYRVGEKLTYNVSFSNFGTAAHVETWVASRGTFTNREGIELRARVETVGVVSAALFAINNEYVSYVDPGTGLPFRTQLIKREQSLPDVLLRAAGQPEVSPGDVLSPPPPSEPTTSLEGTPVTYDLLAALYRLRALPLAPGASYPLTAQNDGLRYAAELKVSGRETIQTPAGSFNTVATQLRVKDSPANNYRISIYFSEDARHLPVLITARLAAGEVRALLASSEMIEPVVAAPPANVARTPPVPSPPGLRPTPSVPPAVSGGAPLPGLPFGVGEELNFNFYLGNATQPIGVANFQVRARASYFNRDGILINANMYTTGAGQRLFAVSDKIDTFIDAKTGLPFRTQLRILEGSHRVEGVVTFEQERGSAVTTDGQPLEIPVGTYELVSVLYAMRSFDLTPPKRNAVSLLINKRPRTLSITALKREVLELGGQRIPAVQLALATDEARGDALGLRLWVSTDRRRLPLRITATTPLGPIRADLSIIPLDRQ